MSSVSFGIGCFSFITQSQPDLEPSNWREIVKRELEEIPAVRNVSIFVEDLDYVIEISKAESGEYSPRYEQNPSMGFLEFTISIPQRVKKEILGLDFLDEALGDTSDEYHVSIRYSWFGPSAFVVRNDGSFEGPGSENVRVVREFLKRELSIRSKILEFYYIGPSPFHADPRVSIDLSMPVGEVRFSREKIPGYDKYDFIVSARPSEITEGGIEDVFEAIQDEIALFYHLQRLRVSKMYEVALISDRTKKLIASYQERPARSLVTKGRSMRSLSLELIRLKYRVRSEIDESLRDISEHYDTSKIEPFRHYLEGASKDEFSYSINNSREAIELLSSHRSKSHEVIFLAAATMLGGLSGAVASIASSAFF